jgi:hypothetical protein
MKSVELTRFAKLFSCCLTSVRLRILLTSLLKVMDDKAEI